MIFMGTLQDNYYAKCSRNSFSNVCTIKYIYFKQSILIFQASCSYNLELNQKLLYSMKLWSQKYKGFTRVKIVFSIVFKNKKKSTKRHCTTFYSKWIYVYTFYENLCPEVYEEGILEFLPSHTTQLREELCFVTSLWKQRMN